VTATTKAPLGATTGNRKWYCDINSGPTDTPVWVGLFGIQEFKHTTEPSMQDDSDFDGDGWKSEVNTANKWSIDGKVKRGVKDGSTPPVYDPGQEILRLAAGKTGGENVVEIRWYEMEANGPRVEAYQGFAAVKFTEEGGGMDALSTASFTLSGRGKRNIITHPDDGV